ncbi:MAG: transketolase [Spirochaetia bacterium]|nr:transketolase [Spirochaetia bacterium]
MTSDELQKTEEIALKIRRLVFEHTIKNNGGYLSQAASSADFLAALYSKILNLGKSIAPDMPLAYAGNPSSMNKNYTTGALYHGEKKDEYDRFFVSPAHYALVIYAALIAVGRMNEKALDLFNKDGSSVEMIGAEHSPGMEVTNGSLAQTLSMASGVAFARRVKKEKGRVWVFISDGEFQEGQTWETFLTMGHYNLNNMAVIADMNGQQCDGAVHTVMQIGDVEQKLRAFGANVMTVDGHNIKEIYRASEIKPYNGPLVILANTSPWRGMNALKKRYPRLHYVRFKSEAEKQNLKEEISKQLY